MMRKQLGDFWRYIGNNLLIFIMFMITVICAVWYTCDQRKLINKNTNVTQQLINYYQDKINDLKIVTEKKQVNDEYSTVQITEKGQTVHIKAEKSKPTINTNDFEKRLAYDFNRHLSFEKEYYGIQNNWLNIWLVFIGIAMAVIGILFQMSYRHKLEDMSEIAKNKLNELGTEYEKRLKEFNTQSEGQMKKLKEEEKQTEKRSEELKITYRFNSIMQYLASQDESRMLASVAEAIDFIKDQEMQDAEKEKYYSLAYQRQTQWYMDRGDQAKKIDAKRNYFNLALKAINNAIEHSPKDYGNYVDKSYILSNLGENKDAINMLEQIMKEPDCVKSHYRGSLEYNLAEAYISDGDLKSAKSLIEKLDFSRISRISIEERDDWENLLNTAAKKSAANKKLADEIWKFITSKYENGKKNDK